jgi:hypothetical protein
VNGGIIIVMKTSDEDLELFLDELITLLNKYHYALPSFTISRLLDYRYKVCQIVTNRQLQGGGTEFTSIVKDANGKLKRFYG